MTVTYTIDVSNANAKGFIKTVFRWKGSLWKLVWHELIIWSILFAIISVCYRTAMNHESKLIFESICSMAYKYGDFIPFSFMLGYYVTLVVGRWQTQFNSIGWVDKSLMLTSSYIRGRSERARILRRGIARHMCLLQVLVFRTICVPVRKRFPTIDSLVTAGYLLADEKVDMEDNKFWLPIKWCMAYVKKARDEGMITSDNAVSDIYQSLCALRGELLSLWLADWVPVPLNYTQIVFVSVRMYFVVMILGRQILSAERYPHRYPVESYVPFLSMIQLVVYIGWLKVAEALLNPFGEDDNDFECNWIIDRNFKVALNMAEMGAESSPPLVKDINWNNKDIAPYYSTATLSVHKEGPVGSASMVDLPNAHMISQDILNERRRPSFATRVSSAIKSFNDPSHEKFNEISSISSRRNSNSTNALPNSLGNRNWSISSFGSDTEIEIKEMTELKKSTLMKGRKEIVRNYSDIAEGEEEDSNQLDSLQEHEIGNFVSEGGHCESKMSIDKMENLRKVQSAPQFSTSKTDGSPHILFPNGKYEI